MTELIAVRVVCVEEALSVPFVSLLVVMFESEVISLELVVSSVAVTLVSDVTVLLVESITDVLVLDVS